MNNKNLKIYVYPFLILIFSIAPWFLFANYVLKIDFDHFIYQSIGCDNQHCVRNFKLFFVVLLGLIYIGWVSANMWLENSRNTLEKEKKLESFALNHGKIFIGLIVGQSVIIFLLAIIVFSR